MSSVSAAALVSAFGGFNGAAARTVKAASESGDGLVEASVDLSQAKTQVGAAMAVARTADEMTGTLFDMLA